ncbi:MAG: hypothetical protein NUV63_05070 [Gallionella sp.]|nr:hypothetical protein [Gallionella sp.]
MTHHFLRIVAILSLLASTAGTVQALPPAQATGIRILVYGIHHGGNIVYHYKVINNGDTPFNNFTIGSEFDSEEDYAFPQLLRRPLGWKYGRESETGTEIILDPASTSQPPYWTSRMYGQQDIYFRYLEWNSHLGDESSDIHPGQTVAGFSVTIPLVDNKLLLPAVKGQPVFTGPDEKYVKGSFMVAYSPGGKYQKVWGTLERIDTTPPSLTVSLSPNTLWPPNDKLVPVTATITVNDDYDPMPEIKIETITSNEGLVYSDYAGATPGDDRQFQLLAKRAGTNMAGRIYTVTYSATDGSGNKATASATVTVPHDQGK